MSKACDNVIRTAVIAFLGLLSTNAAGQQSKTVIGSSNQALQEGADALKAGDAKEGVRLTLLGLSLSGNAQERQTAKSNLCAGYALLEKYETALSYCNEVLLENDAHWRTYSNRAFIYIKLRQFEKADQDLQKGEAISPEARTLKAVRRMYLDATNPVAPSIVIDDRRDPDAGDVDAN